jgi:hypothetical protein
MECEALDVIGNIFSLHSYNMFIYLSSRVSIFFNLLDSNYFYAFLSLLAICITIYIHVS